MHSYRKEKDTLAHKSELAGLSGTFCPVTVERNFPRTLSRDRDKRAKVMSGEQNKEGH